MSPQADYVVSNGTGAAVRSDINGQLSAIVTQNSGATEPTTTYAFMKWADTTAGVMKMRNSANSAWIELFELDGEFGSKTFNGNVTLNAQGDLRFADSDSSNWVAFQSPATVSSNVTWTLPSADGTNGQALTTNGSGTLSWTSPAATTDKITEGNTEAEVVDTGSDGHFKVTTEGTERLRINSSGNVGIGTTSPGELLHVYNSAATSRLIVGPAGTGAATPNALALEQENTGYTVCHVRNLYNNAGLAELRLGGYGFTTFTSGSSQTERARIDSSGRLLVGTSSGSAQLQVHGQIAIGNGLNGTEGGSQGGSAIKTTSWSASGSSHTFSMSSYSPGLDNFSGLVVISGVLKNNTTNGKAATILGSVNKRYGVGIIFTEISNTKNNMTTFSCTVSGNDLVVSTDASCNVCIAFIGGY